MPRPRRTETKIAKPTPKAARRSPTGANAANAEEPESRKRRTKGSGYLFKRGSVWFVRWVSSGKVFCRSTKETTRRVAEKRARRRRRSL